MSETTTEPDRARSRRLSDKARGVIGVTMLLAAAGLGGYLVGRGTAPAPEPTASECVEAKDAVDRLVNETTDAGSDAEPATQRMRGGTVANLVLQNPDCFDVEMRATAQTIKDQMGQAAP